LYQLDTDKDILGKWSALDALVALVKDEKTTIIDKEKIYTALRKTALGKSYWRLRVYALFQLRTALTQPYDAATIAMLLKVIKQDKSWVRASAINFLGMTKEAKYADIYIHAFDDKSDRVINAAANALGKSKSPKAFDALVKLQNKPSWKSQSLISTLNGLKELGDPRGAEVAFNALSDIKSARWWLATPTWDYPVAAAQTIVALGKGDTAFPMILERFKKSMTENDVNDIFSNALLIATLADPRGQEVFDLLKVKYKDDANAMNAVSMYETQFQGDLKK
jgi:aminopeptidase N